MWVREAGSIPWEHVVDETCEPEVVASWDHPEDLIRAAVSQYRKYYWQAQPRRVEVWSEKGAVRGTLAPVLNRYGVTFRVMHGYGSATAPKGIADETAATDKPLIVLYVGDFDPSGMHISEVDIPERLARYQATATVRRVALTRSDVESGALPSFTAADKVRDPRHQWFTRRYGQRCWELDALPPPVLRERVENHIRELLDLDTWERMRMVEAAEVESMRDLLTTWNESKSRQAS